MTLEEAVSWCVEECIEVHFYTLDDRPTVIVYEHGNGEFLGRGETLIEAVQESIKRGPRIEGAVFYKRKIQQEVMPPAIVGTPALPGQKYPVPGQPAATPQQGGKP